MGGFTRGLHEGVTGFTRGGSRGGFTRGGSRGWVHQKGSREGSRGGSRERFRGVHERGGFTNERVHEGGSQGGFTSACDLWQIVVGALCIFVLCVLCASRRTRSVQPVGLGLVLKAAARASAWQGALEIFYEAAEFPIARGKGEEPDR